jgi:hypothetical protein
MAGVSFLPGVSQRSFRLVDRQPELGHHRLRPRECLRRATAAEGIPKDKITAQIGSALSFLIFLVSAEALD